MKERGNRLNRLPQWLARYSHRQIRLMQKPSTSSTENTKTSESSSASIDTPDAIPRSLYWKSHVGPMTKLVALLVWWFLGAIRWINLDTRNYQWSFLPIRWMSDHNQTVDATYANGNNSGVYHCFGLREMRMSLFCSLPLKDGTPFDLYSPTTNGGVYYVKNGKCWP